MAWRARSSCTHCTQKAQPPLFPLARSDQCLPWMPEHRGSACQRVAYEKPQQAKRSTGITSGNRTAHRGAGELHPKT